MVELNKKAFLIKKMVFIASRYIKIQAVTGQCITSICLNFLLYLADVTPLPRKVNTFF